MKILTYIFIIVSVVSCKSQKTSKMNIPVIDNSSEVFSSPEKLLNIDKFAKKDSQIEDEFSVNISKNIYEVRNKNRQYIIYYTRSDDPLSHLSGYDYSENPYVGIFRSFHPNNYIETKGLYCVFGFKIGIWYHYDSNGVLLSTEDTDAGFTLDYKKILRFCEENDIPLRLSEKGMRFRTQISRGISAKENQKYYWRIEYTDFRADSRGTFVILIDDKTKEIYEKKTDTTVIFE